MFAGAHAPAVLTGEQLDAIHAQAMTILEEIGTDVRDPEALALLREQGQRVDGERVRWDREFVTEMVSRAPSRFTLTPRNPDRAGGGTRSSAVLRSWASSTPTARWCGTS